MSTFGAPCRGQGEFAGGKPLPEFFSGCGGGVHGRRSLLEGAVAASLGPSMLRMKVQDPRIGRWRRAGVVCFMKPSPWSSQRVAFRRCGGVSSSSSFGQSLFSHERALYPSHRMAFASFSMVLLCRSIVATSILTSWPSQICSSRAHPALLAPWACRLFSSYPNGVDVNLE